MRVDFRWHHYRYLPYEQVLAKRELAALFGRQAESVPGGLRIEADLHWAERAYRTTYFREAVAENGERVIPLQAMLEGTANGMRHPGLPGMQVAPVLRRQSTRYSAHGLHEYRGKFNPQIVRAVANLLGVSTGDWVLDPFCGSGTTLLEAAHGGWNAIGIDLNPLAVHIARAKIAAMRVPLSLLREQTDAVATGLRARAQRLSFDRAFSDDEIRQIAGPGWVTRLPGGDHLSAWFTNSVLAQVSAVVTEIAALPSPEVRLILEVVLSDLLRDVSLQDPADLRIRRRKDAPENVPLIPRFLDSLSARLELIVRARECVSRVSGVQHALVGDVRSCSAILRGRHSCNNAAIFRAAITSPPYATALPYIDTQRLSLITLGLIAPNEVRSTESRLIGSREMTTRERRTVEAAMASDDGHLPSECLTLCRELADALRHGRDGFRRQNVPALVYKYLVDMRSAFRQVRELLAPRAPLALVVGRNRTVLGGKVFVLDTPRLLATIARDSGFELEEVLELDTYQRFDVHQANSIRSEALVVLRKR